MSLVCSNAIWGIWSSRGPLYIESWFILSPLIFNSSIVQYYRKVGQCDWLAVYRGQFHCKADMTLACCHWRKAPNLQHKNLCQTALSSEHWSTLRWLWLTEPFHREMSVTSSQPSHMRDGTVWKSLRRTVVVLGNRLRSWCCCLLSVKSLCNEMTSLQLTLIYNLMRKSFSKNSVIVKYDQIRCGVWPKSKK